MRARSPVDLEQLAADAAPDDLDRVARHAAGARRGGGLGRERPPRCAASARRGVARRSVRSVAGSGRWRSSSSSGASRAPRSVAQEAARRLEVLGPAAALALAQLGDERLGLGARGGEPARARLRRRRALVSRSRAALLEPRDGAREVAALAREQALGRLERAGGQAVPARDRQREALADGVVVEPEARARRWPDRRRRRRRRARARRARRSSPAGSGR